MRDFWAMPQAKVLDRQDLAACAAADAAVTATAARKDLHRLHRELG
jgi:hypothetical protein